MTLRFLPHAASVETGKKFEIACTDDSVQLGDEYEIGVAPAGGIVFDSTVTSLNKEGKILFVSSLGFTQPGTYTISANAVLNPTNRVETTVQVEKPSVVINLPASEDEIPPIPDTEAAPGNAEDATNATPATPEVTAPALTTDQPTDAAPATDTASKKKSNALVYGALAILALIIGTTVFMGVQAGKNSFAPAVTKTEPAPKPEPKQEAKAEEKTDSDKPSQAAPTTTPSAPPAAPAPAPASTNSSDPPRMPTPPESWPTTPQTVQHVHL